MDVLIRYGFSIEEIKYMMDTNQEIETVPDQNIYDLIDILGKVGCMSNHIKNIFLCNPFYLNRNPQDIEMLTKKLYNIGLENLYVVFDTNPFILNLNEYDIEKIIKKKNGFSQKDIIKYFYYECDYVF